MPQYAKSHPLTPLISPRGQNQIKKNKYHTSSCRSKLNLPLLHNSSVAPNHVRMLMVLPRKKLFFHFIHPWRIIRLALLAWAREPHGCICRGADSESDVSLGGCLIMMIIMIMKILVRLAFTIKPRARTRSWQTILRGVHQRPRALHRNHKPKHYVAMCRCSHQ